MRKHILTIAAVAIVLGVGVPQAGATAVLYLNDLGLSGETVIIGDGLPAGSPTPYGTSTIGDPDLTANGLVTYNTTINGGLVGSVFTVNVTAGVSKPIIGPNMIDLSSLNVSTGGAGNLLVGFADTDFSLPVVMDAAVYNLIGGTTDGTVTTQYGANPANTVFAGPFSNQGPFGPGAFSGTDAFTVAGLGNPFSISAWVDIVHTGAGNTSFDMTTKVPEPSTLLLLGAGMGLLGAGRILRRRRG